MLERGDRIETSGEAFRVCINAWALSSFHFFLNPLYHFIWNAFENLNRDSEVLTQP